MIARIWLHAAASLISLPFQLSAEVARGVRMARQPETTGEDTIIHGPKWLANAEAERDTWDMGELPRYLTEVQGSYTLCGNASAAADAEIRRNFGMQAAAGPYSFPETYHPDTPAAPAVNEDDGAAGSQTFPTPHWRTLAAAAFGLEQWMQGNKCSAPTYFKSIAADLNKAADALQHPAK